MSGREAAKRRRAARQGEPTGPMVTVCRGCCCGTQVKHPDVDHAGQLALLRAGIVGTGQLRVSDCLDACEHSNVMIVTPSPAGRKAGARPVWLGEVLDEDTTAAVAEWVADGGPGVVDSPVTLDVHEFRPSRRVRLAADQ